MTDPTPQPPTRDEADGLGELIYRALYEHEGGIWSAVEDRDKETVWNAAGRRLAAMLASAPAPASGGVDCVSCHGTGAIEDGSFCSSCEGTGVRGFRITDEMVKAAFDALNTKAKWVVWSDDIRAAFRAAFKIRAAFRAAFKASLSPAATPVSEAGGEAYRVVKVIHGETFSYQPGALVKARDIRDGKAVVENLNGMGCIVGVPMDRLALAKPASSPAGGPPPGYHPLPSGTACKCIKVWQDGKGNYWCCRPVSVAPSSPAGGEVVREALDWLDGFNAYRAGPCAQDVRTAFISGWMHRAEQETALSQSTSAGRVGE